MLYPRFLILPPSHNVFLANSYVGKHRLGKASVILHSCLCCYTQLSQAVRLYHHTQQIGCSELNYSTTMNKSVINK